MRAVTQVEDVFVSVLFPAGSAPDSPASNGRRASPDTLRDLALERVVTVLAESTRTADLRTLFSTPLVDADTIRYRQDVFRDLGLAPVRATVDRFEVGLATVGQQRAAADAARYPFERELWLLRAADAAVRSTVELAASLGPALREAGAGSAALAGLARHVETEAASPAFLALRDEVTALVARIDALRVDVWVRGAKVTVSPTDDEPDLERLVAATFDRFRQAADAEHQLTAAHDPGLDHVQAAVLEQVAAVHPGPFADLVSFVGRHPEAIDPALRRAGAELRFYLAYLDLLAPLDRAGLPVCLPRVSTTDKTLTAHDTYDLALARDRALQRKGVVLNDLELTGPERILVVSGPNQGGKTTAARTFGQLHHLAALGCPVPGREVTVFVPDQVLTQFERTESLDTPEGRLGTDLARMHRLLDAATDRSVVVLNEVFTSTTLADARFLTRTVLDHLCQTGALALCVTFLDELSRLGPATVSMVGTVDPDDPTVRTFRVVRRPADGRAYAASLAAKHGLAPDQLARRVSARTRTPDTAPSAPTAGPGGSTNARTSERTTR